MSYERFVAAVGYTLFFTVLLTAGWAAVGLFIGVAIRAANWVIGL